MKQKFLFYFVFLLVLLQYIILAKPTITNATSTFSEINIKQRGAKGDGIHNDWEVIQRAVDELANNGGGTIFFPKGQYAIFDKSIVIWGQNISLRGESSSSSKIIKKGKVGYFGECIDIAGRINGYKYYGGFGKGNYDLIKTYNGRTEKVRNITISHLTVDSRLSDTSQKLLRANTLGVINGQNITINNCIIQNAPQTNLALVNDANVASNENIVLNNCTFKNSLQHNVRVISYNQGEYQGNFVVFNNCKFLSVLGIDKSQKELAANDTKVLFWYRGAKISGKSSVYLNNCFFDASGIIFANSNTNGFLINSSRVESSINIHHSISLDSKPKVVIKNSTFGLKGAQVYIDKLREKNWIKSLIKDYKQTSFGSVYPANLPIIQEP